MGRSTGRRGLAVLGLAALALALAPARSAEAWDTWGRSGGCGCAPRVAPVGWGHRYYHPSTCASRAYRAAVLDAVHTERFHAHGSGWHLLRRHLYRIQIQPTHVHPRAYFYGRWPCRIARVAEAEQALGGHVCIGADHPWTECEIARHALGTEDVTPTPAADLAPMERLERGMERFFRGAFDEARQDFLGAAKALPRDARPHVGVLMCEVMEKDWRQVSGRLQTLHRQGWLDGADRLDLEASFADPKLFAKVRDAVSARARYEFHETDLQVVAGWAFLQTGDLEAARRHLRSATRFAPDHPVAGHLLATMDADPAETEAPPAGEPDAGLPTDAPHLTAAVGE